MLKPHTVSRENEFCHQRAFFVENYYVQFWPMPRVYNCELFTQSFALRGGELTSTIWMMIILQKIDKMQVTACCTIFRFVESLLFDLFQLMHVSPISLELALFQKNSLLAAQIQPSCPCHFHGGPRNPRSEKKKWAPYIYLELQYVHFKVTQMSIFGSARQSKVESQLEVPNIVKICKLLGNIQMTGGKTSIENCTFLLSSIPFRTVVRCPVINTHVKLDFSNNDSQHAEGVT